MSTFAQTTLVRYARWGLVAASIAVTAACGGGGGGGGGTPSTPPSGSVSLSSHGSTSINLVLNANRISGVAPLAVSFDTVGTTSTGTTLPFHDIKYTWDFGDPAGGAVWRFGTKANAVSKASRNGASGPVAAHVFEQPGTYLVKVTAFDGNTTTDKLVTIKVEDPNIIFASKTICISASVLPTPGVDGCPSGAAVQVVSNWASIGTLSSTYKRILLKRGDLWSASSRANIASGPGLIGAFGVATDSPKVNISSNNNALYFSNVSDWRVMDLEVFSSESSIGVSDNNERIPLRAYRGNFLTVLRCKFHDVYMTLLPELSHDFSVFDSEMNETFPNYGTMVAFFYLGERVAVLGSKFSTSHTTHTVRISGTKNAVVSNNQMDSPGPARHAFTLRGWESPNPYTQHVVVSDNVLDGGAGSGYLLYIGVVNNSTNEELRDIIVERNFLKSTSNEIPNVFKVAQNLTYRNNITVSHSEMSLAVLAGGNSAGAPDPVSSYIYNNNFYKSSIANNTRYSAISINGPVLGVRLINNLAFAPGSTMSTGWVAGGGDFIHTSGGATLASSVEVMKNNSTNFQINNVNPWTSSTLSSPEQFVPTGYSIVDGLSNIGLDDYFSSYRSASAKTMGAIAQ